MAQAPAQLNVDDQAATERRRREAQVRFHRPLYDAASSGNWANAEKFLIEHPEAEIALPKLNGMTILHVAAAMGHAVFIKKLLSTNSVRVFPREALKHLDDFNWSALHYAASYGNLGVVKVLVSEDNTLTQVLDGGDNNTPLRQAANNAANKRVLWYLAKRTTNDPPAGTSGPLPFSDVKAAQLINALAAAGFYDICLYLLKIYPLSAKDLLNEELDLLMTLTRWADQFPSGSRLKFWERWIYHFIPIDISDLRGSQQQQFSKRIIHWIFGAASKVPILNHIRDVPILNRIIDVKYKHECIMELLEVICEKMSTWETKDIVAYLDPTEPSTRTSVIHWSAKTGVIEIIIALIKHTPDYMDTFQPNVNIIRWAIDYRRELVFNFMIERDVFVKLLPEYLWPFEEKETYLHAAAKLAPYARLTSVSSPALQMQRELQWLQGVEKVVRPIMKTYVNAKGQTAKELFTTEHEVLAEKAERWLKDTASSCLVVAALVITVVFAAAFTIPGGNADGTGIPFFLNRWYFTVFVISDAVGMFSAATSILMFLSILTARYAMEDFLSALPTRLIFGLVSLLIALVSMMVAFGAAIYMILRHAKKKWVVYSIIGIAPIPAVLFLFIVLQLPLISYMVKYTYVTSILKPLKTPW